MFFQNSMWLKIYNLNNPEKGIKIALIFTNQFVKISAIRV